MKGNLSLNYTAKYLQDPERELFKILIKNIYYITEICQVKFVWGKAGKMETSKFY